MRKLELTINGLKKNIIFKKPEKKEEFALMFKLREKIYREKNYLKKEVKNDIDEFDTDDCIYLIAKIDDVIIGSLRMLIKNKSIRKHFLFEDPDNIKKVDELRRVEIGRLVITKHSISNEYLPRNIILLMLISEAFSVTKNLNIECGYAFIKEKLKQKLQKLKFPIKEIKNYSCSVKKESPMYDYFYNKDDPVSLVYFLNNDVEKFLYEWTDSKIIKKHSEHVYSLNNNLYTKILKSLNII